MMYDFLKEQESVILTFTSTSTFTSKSSSSVKMKKSKVFHVINIYATNKDDPNDPIHQPYDQWVALQSIMRAKRHLPHDLEVTVICAIFPSDMEFLSKKKMVPACDRWVQLNRSTMTEYGKNSTTRTSKKSKNARGSMEEQVSEYFSELEIPFVQDLLDEAVWLATEQSRDEDSDEDFYIMLTNADIGLTKNFYKFLLPELQKGRKAFQINRLTIPMDDGITIRKATTNKTEIKTLLAQIDASIPNGKKHPGHDCFFIHSSIIDQVFLGKMFLGFPPWANALRILFRDILLRGNYTAIESNPYGTFHLGNDQKWKQQEQEHEDKNKFMQTKYQEEIAQCPNAGGLGDITKPASFLNLANCGATYREHYPHLLQQIEGARCKYCKQVGWTISNDTSCEEFRLGAAPYPWESTRRVYNITSTDRGWFQFTAKSKYRREHCRQYHFY